MSELLFFLLNAAPSLRELSAELTEGERDAGHSSEGALAGRTRDAFSPTASRSPLPEGAKQETGTDPARFIVLLQVRRLSVSRFS